VEFTYIGIGELDGVSGLVAFAMDGEIVLKADFSSGAEYQIVVTDLTGRGIATGLWPTEPGSNTLRINVPSALAGGIYIVSIQHGTEKLVKRIAVQ
jgi:hypothetical protein